VKRILQGSPARTGERGYSLTELLCSIGIVLLLAALMVPGMRNGYAKGKRLYCVNNLHQMGLGFHSFAHDHHDRFPTQVSTNDGGVLELVQAANSQTGAFYFSYRYFLPLSNELVTPKVLNCPADTRRAATNFAGLQNENLSYFAAGTPEFGNPFSPVAGNRNVFPAFGSIARVGTYRRLMWTEELHRYKGNVLFGDAHVEQLDDVFCVTNSGVASASLHIPSERAEPPPGGGVQYPGFQQISAERAVGRANATCLPGFTNHLGTNAALSNWVVSARPSIGRFLAGSEMANAGGAGPPAVPARDYGERPASAVGLQARHDNEAVDPWSLKGMYQQVVTKAPVLLRQAATVVYEIPWYLLLLMLALLFELRRRVRARQKRAAPTRHLIPQH
jgi:hypothetical protein